MEDYSALLSLTPKDTFLPESYAEWTEYVTDVDSTFTEVKLKLPDHIIESF